MFAGHGAAAIWPRTGSTGSVRGRCPMRGDQAPAAMTTCSALILPAGISTPVARPRIVLRRVTRVFSVRAPWRLASRSEEHTSELQSRRDLVCRLLLEKKKRPNRKNQPPHNKTYRANG